MATGVLFVMGTRPEAIKLAPVLRLWRERCPNIEAQVAVTGQHSELLRQALDLFGITPTFDGRIMQHDQSLSDLTQEAIRFLNGVIEWARPRWVIVQGDTTSALVGAQVSHWHHSQVAHIEAGLRSGDKWRPFPEEMNRRLIAQLADLHFAPTPRAVNNLVTEGVQFDRIHLTGNTVVDALYWAQAQAPSLDSQFPFLAEGKLVLVTCHRREAHGKGLRGILEAIGRLAKTYANCQFIYPVHPNPNVRGPAQEQLKGMDNIYCIEPVDYLTLIALLRRAYLVLTDSGGIQEEAPSFHVPVLVLRQETERPELIEAGAGWLVGTDPDEICANVAVLMEDEETYRQMAEAPNPFGDGKAAERIVKVLRSSYARQGAREVTPVGVN